MPLHSGNINMAALVNLPPPTNVAGSRIDAESGIFTGLLTEPQLFAASTGPRQVSLPLQPLLPPTADQLPNFTIRSSDVHVAVITKETHSAFSSFGTVIVSPAGGISENVNQFAVMGEGSNAPTVSAPRTPVEDTQAIELSLAQSSSTSCTPSIPSENPRMTSPGKAHRSDSTGSTLIPSEILAAAQSEFHAPIPIASQPGLDKVVNAVRFPSDSWHTISSMKIAQGSEGDGTERRAVLLDISGAGDNSDSTPASVRIAMDSIDLAPEVKIAALPVSPTTPLSWEQLYTARLIATAQLTGDEENNNAPEELLRSHLFTGIGDGLMPAESAQTNRRSQPSDGATGLPLHIASPPTEAVQHAPIQLEMLPSRQRQTSPLGFGDTPVLPIETVLIIHALASRGLSAPGGAALFGAQHPVFTRQSTLTAADSPPRSSDAYLQGGSIVSLLLPGVAARDIPGAGEMPEQQFLATILLPQYARPSRWYGSPLTLLASLASVAPDTLEKPPGQPHPNLSGLTTFTPRTDVKSAGIVAGDTSSIVMPAMPVLTPSSLDTAQLMKEDTRIAAQHMQGREAAARMDAVFLTEALAAEVQAVLPHSEDPVPATPPKMTRALPTVDMLDETHPHGAEFEQPRLTLSDVTLPTPTFFPDQIRGTVTADRLLENERTLPVSLFIENRGTDSPVRLPIGEIPAAEKHIQAGTYQGAFTVMPSVANQPVREDNSPTVVVKPDIPETRMPARTGGIPFDVLTPGQPVLPAVKVPGVEKLLSNHGLIPSVTIEPLVHTDKLAWELSVTQDRASSVSASAIARVQTLPTQPTLRAGSVLPIPPEAAATVLPGRDFTSYTGTDRARAAENSFLFSTLPVVTETPLPPAPHAPQAAMPTSERMDAAMVTGNLAGSPPAEWLPYAQTAMAMTAAVPSLTSPPAFRRQHVEIATQVALEEVFPIDDVFGKLGDDSSRSVPRTIIEIQTLAQEPEEGIRQEKRDAALAGIAVSVQEETFTERDRTERITRHIGQAPADAHTMIAPPSQQHLTELTPERREPAIDADALLRQVAVQARRVIPETASTISIRLDPPELGTLRIIVQAHNGEVVARIESPHQAVCAALDHRLSELRQVLDDAGIRVSACQVSVNTQAGREGPAQWQLFQQGGQNLAQAVSRPATGPAGDDLPQQVMSGHARQMRLLDLFA